jgi:hypothetical protein
MPTQSETPRTKKGQKQLELSIGLLSNGEYDRHIFCSGFHGVCRGCSLLMPCALPNLVSMQNMGYKVYGGVVAMGENPPSRRVVSPRLVGHVQAFKRAVALELWKGCKVSMSSITWQHEHLAHGTAFTSETYSLDEEYFANLVRF